MGSDEASKYYSFEYFGKTQLGTDLKSDSLKKCLLDYLVVPSTIPELGNFFWYKATKIPISMYRFVFADGDIPDFLANLQSNPKYYGPRRDQPHAPELPYPVSPTSLGILENYGPWLGPDLTRR